MKKSHFIYSLVLAGFIFFVLHSLYFFGDAVLHVPFILKTIDKSLYQHDYIFGFPIPQQTITGYYPLVALVTNTLHLQIEQSLRILYFVYLYIFAYALLALSKKITGTFRAGTLLCIVLSFNFQIGGSAIFILEADFLPRSTSLALLLLAVSFGWSRKYVAAFLFLICSLLVHPIAVIFLVIFIGLDFLIKKIGVYRTSGLFLLCTVVVWIGAWLLQLKVDSAWIHILWLRNSYAFLQLWPLKAWLALLILLVPGIVYTRLYADNKTLIRIFAITFFGAVFVTLTHFIFAVIYPVPFVIALQLCRIWIFPILISLLCLTDFLSSVTTLRLFSLTILLLLLVSFLLNQLRYNYAIDQNWIAVQNAASRTTEKNCIFLVPFNMSGFRMASQRAITGELKDGTFSFYSRDFALEWWKRRNDLDRWEEMSDSEVSQLSSRYNVNYAVAPIVVNRIFPVVYKNAHYQIFEINSHCR